MFKSTLQMNVSLNFEKFALRKIKVVQAFELELLDDSGIRPKVSFEYAARQAGGQSFLGYTKRDHKNYLRDKRQESLKHGLDDDSLITNVFWVDAKMIRDFKMYEDVVSFYTPYRTNKEYRPLALFVGLNNHSEMIIFGAAVLYEESTESFDCFFNAFFRIMSIDKPQTFMTDQDPAIASAVSSVMPQTYGPMYEKRTNENKSNFDMTQRIPILKVKLSLLIHARDIYTPTIFDIFQNEWERSLLVSVKDIHDEGDFCTYNVRTYGSVKEHAIIMKRSVTQVYCSCKMFEFMGILCRHALKILDILNVKDMIPAYYILKMWTKDVANMHEMDINLVTKDSNPKVEVIARYKHLCQTFIQISSKASGCKEGYELAAIFVNELITKLNDIKKRKESVEEPIQDNNIQNEANETVFVDNSNISKVTGLK
ncbi:hypothetical protein FXO37_06490 [Capsicum annuum]|nr:hypothetical protein FXO37_06490 [Capsicum annuum]